MGGDAYRHDVYCEVLEALLDDVGRVGGCMLRRRHRLQRGIFMSHSINLTSKLEMQVDCVWSNKDDHVSMY